MSNHLDFVVYAYSRPDWTFYYIGKGRPNRPYSNKRKVKRPLDKKHIHILHKGLSNSTAVEYEKALILFYGRKDLYPQWGILRNMTDGGEGTVNYVFTTQHRENLSIANSGKIRTKEQRENMSNSKMGPKNPMYGKPSPVKGSKHRLYAPFHWFHPICGEVLNKSASELVEMFPEQSLKRNSLGLLRRGVLLHTKGWRTLSCPIGGEMYIKHEGRYHQNYSPLSWFHPLIGEIYNKTCSEMCKLFPEHKLSSGNLRKVSRGEITNHCGWKPICCPIKP